YQDWLSWWSTKQTRLVAFTKVRIKPKRFGAQHFFMSQISIERVSSLATIAKIKSLADQHRSELGFHSHQAFIDSSQKKELLVAKVDGQVKGFVRFHHRR